MSEPSKSRHTLCFVSPPNKPETIPPKHPGLFFLRLVAGERQARGLAPAKFGSYNKLTMARRSAVCIAASAPRGNGQAVYASMPPIPKKLGLRWAETRKAIFAHPKLEE